MSTRDRRRSWTEIALGAVSLVVLVLTATWPDWIELLFGIDPDGGSGALEWGLVAVLAAGAAVLPWHGARRLRAAAASPVG